MGRFLIMATSPIKAVFLDAGNTLFTEKKLRSAIYADIAEEFRGAANPDLSKEAMSLAYTSLPQSIDGCFRFSLGWFRFFNAMVYESLGVSTEDQEDAHQRTVAVFEDPSTYHLFEEVPEVLTTLKDMGLQIGIISNWSERLPELCAGLGIADQVDFITASAEIRSEKPDGPIYARALFRAGVPAEEALHVGDRMDRDVRGALKAGLRTAFLDRSQKYDKTREGIPVLHNLSELLPLIKSVACATS
jgi:REG-2-like HAD superfamily hydrolase